MTRKVNLWICESTFQVPKFDQDGVLKNSDVIDNCAEIMKIDYKSKQQIHFGVFFTG